MEREMLEYIAKILRQNSRFESVELIMDENKPTVIGFVDGSEGYYLSGEMA